MRRELLIFFLCLLNLSSWLLIFNAGQSLQSPEIYFLNVGQGDSELLAFQSGVRVLLDAGPDRSVLRELDKIVSRNNRYLDLVILSHPDSDHLNGIFEVLKSYQIGAILYAEAEKDNKSLKILLNECQKQNILTIALAKNDLIKNNQERIKVLAPKESEKAKTDNDLSLALQFEDGFGRALFTGDLSSAKEKNLASEYDLKSDILKVSHHGSKNSSNETFLKEVNPLVAVVEVGKNSYGHPASEALERIKALGAKIYRTDRSGSFKIVFGGEGLKIMEFR